MVFGQKSYVETTHQRSESLYVSSSIIVTIAGFIFTACFFAVMYQSAEMDIGFIVSTLMKTLVLVSLMMLGATVISKVFHSAVTRNANAFLLGLVFGVFLVFFSI